MTRLSIFDNPLLLGFDNFERILDRVSKSSADGYPPYNIEQTGENGLRITLAVAGFSEDDLGVTVEDNQLAVSGRGREDESDRVYLHRGIATRAFERRFHLADHVSVSGAGHEHGMLNIDLVREVPEALKPRRIEIASGNTVEAKVVEKA